MEAQIECALRVIVRRTTLQRRRLAPGGILEMRRIGRGWWIWRIVCMLITCSRVWIDGVGLPILLVVSWTGKINIPLSLYVPDNFVSRDGFSRPVPPQPAHSPYSGWIWCLLTGFLPISVAASIYLFQAPCAIGSVPTLSGDAIACQWRSLPRVCRHRVSINSPQGSSSNGCCHFAGQHVSI